MKTNFSQKTTIVQILFRIVGIFLVSILIAFSSIYLVTKGELAERTENELTSVTEIIKQSIESTHESTKTLEHLIDLRLYTISKAIGEELKGRNIDEVNAEELEKLKMKWGLSEISLLVPKPNGDIVVQKSTEPKEVGLSARNWGYWYIAIKELLEGKEISVSKGYSQKHYWVGPLSLSDVVDEHYKYAYYYDGTTKFIINPFVEAEDIYQFMQTSGPTQLIEKMKAGYENIHEIAVINTEAYLKGPENKVVEPMSDIPVLYGSHETKLAEDSAIFKELSKTPGVKKIKFEKGHSHLEKLYISLPDERVLVLLMNIDDQQAFMTHLWILFAMIFTLTVAVIFIFSQAATRKPLKLLNAERERLMVAEDFKRTIELLPSAIYKCRKEKDGRYILLYSEGTYMEQRELTTERVKGKYIEDIFSADFTNKIIPALNGAYEEERAEFTFEQDNRTYHHVIKAICDIEEPEVVIELAGYSVDITDRVKADEKIHQLALHDSLTGLPNRVYFNEMLEQALQNQKGEKVAVVFIDLDNFKQVNDTLGHEAGDQLLVQVTNLLTKCIGSEAILARMGGDEFILLLPRCGSKEEVERLCQHIIQQLKQPFYIMDQELFVTSSMGISIAPDDGHTGKLLLKNADIAMYSSKNNGKNNYHFYETHMSSDNLKKMELQKDLRQALQSGGDLYLVYQPQLNLLTNQVVGVEALLRWNHPVRGMISPAEFIPVAEESGLIEPLGDWVIRQACQQFIAWKEEGIGPLRMSVNISARQFRHHDLAQKISRLLEETGMDAQYLNLEITESTSMEDISHTIKVINQLRNMGVDISIDDFGTGYSSLNYLKDFPINHLKIDHSFIREMKTNEAGKAIVKTIIDMAVNLNLQVVAEGVEAKSELEMLRNMGCHEIQGYYFSRPVEPERLKVILADLLLVAPEQSPRILL
ncbi:diguanylate cyclase (GGDEF)-like protein [Bacillus fengqiuensis]|nr:diguanylate cyclase (GGDEF)-like protein [Bacillus fengqiuensis]